MNADSRPRYRRGSCAALPTQAMRCKDDGLSKTKAMSKCEAIVRRQGFVIHFFVFLKHSKDSDMRSHHLEMSAKDVKEGEGMK